MLIKFQSHKSFLYNYYQVKFDDLKENTEERFKNMM
jgi:hypothetical protein